MAKLLETSMFQENLQDLFPESFGNLSGHQSLETYVVVVLPSSNTLASCRKKKSESFT
jgi:hypothetical protein